MSDETDPGALLATITPAPNIPQVAIFTISIPKDSQVRVEFGPTTAYGRVTSYVPAPPGGGPVTILVAGMIASTTYHMRARIELENGWWTTTPAT